MIAAPVGDPAVEEIVASHAWDRVIATLPASSAYFRFLDLPFRDRKRLAQAVGPMLEEHVPVSLDDATTSFDSAGEGSSSATLAALARRATVEARVAELAQIGVTPTMLIWQPTAIIAAYRAALDVKTPTLAVDVGIDSTLVARLMPDRVEALRIVSRHDDEGFEHDVRWAVRTLEGASDPVVFGGAMYETAGDRLRAALEGTRIDLLPHACPVPGADHADGVWRTLTASVGLVLVATGDAKAPILSFHADATDRAVLTEQRSDAVRTLAPWAAAAALLFATALTVDYVRLHRTAARLDKTAEKLFAAAMPGVAGGAGRRTKIELKLGELESKRNEAAGAARPDGPVGTLVTLSHAIPADLGVEFETFAYDPPNVRLRGRGASFEVVTKLQETLRGTPAVGAVDVGDVRSNAAGGGVDFELTVRLGEPSS